MSTLTVYTPIAIPATWENLRPEAKAEARSLSEAHARRMLQGLAFQQDRTLHGDPTFAVEPEPRWARGRWWISLRADQDATDNDRSSEQES